MASVRAHVSRRFANTALTVTTTSSPCVICTDQCWFERFVRTARASISNAPAASGPQKLTVNAAGSPSRWGAMHGACSITAAMAPPNGPTMFA